MTENSFDKIKKLIRIIGGKVIIIEDGKPSFVIINIDEYIDFENTENSSTKIVYDDIEKIEKEEKINKDINIWKSRQDEKKMKQFKMEQDFENNDSKKEQTELNNDIIVEDL